ncbi:MAG: hypothetical protein MUC50_11100 [Myxococcota bacterium]|jgi:hypothetical protein|nr:hypothetical protein [Myxococcota bacterium]
MIKKSLLIGFLSSFVPLAASAQGSDVQTEREDTPPTQPMGGQNPEALIERAVASLPREPSLETLEDAALTYLDAHPDAVRRLLHAPRRAALLPEVRLVANLNQERDESVDRYQDEPDRWGADSDHDLGFQLSATWRLDRLVYSPDQARAHAVLVDRAERREAVLSTLIRAYFERRKHQIRLLLNPPTDPLAYLDSKERIEELAALINALTGGALRRHAFK